VIQSEDLAFSLLMEKGRSRKNRKALLPEKRWTSSRECNQNCEMKLTAAYKKVDDWWAAWVEEIPGVNTQGATLEEARENLRDALRMVLEANRELSEKEQEATRR
jgi:predicted RNase H-like HicB family nuclease